MKFWAAPFVWWLLKRPGNVISASVARETRSEVRTKLSRLIRSRWFEPPFGGLGFSRLLAQALDSMRESEAGAPLLPPGHPLEFTSDERAPRNRAGNSTERATAPSGQQHRQGTSTGRAPTPNEQQHQAGTGHGYDSPVRGAPPRLTGHVEAGPSPRSPAMARHLRRGSRMARPPATFWHIAVTDGRQQIYPMRPQWPIPRRALTRSRRGQHAAFATTAE